MKKLILVLSILFVLPTLTYAAIPLTQEKTLIETVEPGQKERVKTVTKKKDRKIVSLYKKLLKKIGVPEKGEGSGLLNGLSLGAAVLGIILLATGSAAALASLPLAIAAVVLGILGLRKGRSLKGLGIAGIIIGGTVLFLFLLLVVILASLEW